VSILWCVTDFYLRELMLSVRVVMLLLRVNDPIQRNVLPILRQMMLFLRLGNVR
jgi:hypothetical protein